MVLRREELMVADLAKRMGMLALNTHFKREEYRVTCKSRCCTHVGYCMSMHKMQFDRDGRLQSGVRGRM